MTETDPSASPSAPTENRGEQPLGPAGDVKTPSEFSAERPLPLEGERGEPRARAAELLYALMANLPLTMRQDTAQLDDARQAQLEITDPDDGARFSIRVDRLD